MRFEAGKEVEFARLRLCDIRYFAQHTRPVDDDWKGYAETLRNLIISQANEALAAIEAAGANT